jgi:hypothetical protein
MSPSDTLKVITDIEFTPVYNSQTQLTVRNFDKLNSLPSTLLSPGAKEIEIEGYITYLPRAINKTDKDIHFTLSPTASQSNKFIVCEIQNATKSQYQTLKKTKDQQKIVKVKGIFRIFLEHILKNSKTKPHVFEVHPVKTVEVDGVNLKGITMDCPDHGNWRKNESMYQMEIQQNRSLNFINLKNGKAERNVKENNMRVDYDGSNLTFKNIPTAHGFRAVGHNYIAIDGYFSKTSRGSFPSGGKSYTFELKYHKNPSIRLKAITIDGTPAYNTAKKFHSNPPTKIITAVALRSVSISKLMDKVYETVLCPAYRLEKSVSG